MTVPDRVKSLRRVRAGDLKPHPANWRKHPPQQQRAMRAALQELGYCDAVIVREMPDGGLQLIDGHLRAGLDPDQRLPAIVLDVTEEEASKLLLTLDPIAAMASVDLDAIRELAGNLDFEQPDLEAVVAGLLGLNGGDVVEDEPPAPPDEPVTQTGDVWVLGDHRLLCGDSRDEGDVERLWNNTGSCDAVVTDPPYGVEYVGKTAQALTIENDGTAGLGALLSAALGLAFRLSRDGAVWYVAAPAGPQFHDFSVVLRDLGIWRQTLVWAKDTMVLGRSDYHYQHEVLLYGWRPGAAHREPPDRKQTTVWQIDRPKASREHPTMKPVALFARAIGNSTAEDELVYDPFMGSGTTLIACEQLGRRCLGVEISPAYCDVTVRRWETLAGRKARRERKPRRKPRRAS